MTLHFPFEHTYAALPANFFARVQPTPVAAPRLIKLNRELAVQLGLDPDQLSTPEGAEILSGKRLPEGAQPIAMAYLAANHALPNHEVYAEVRGKRQPMRVSPMPFAPHRYFRG